MCMLIKGPFSYSGNKYKIFDKHLRQVVSEFDNVIELFAGSAPLVYNSKITGLAVDIEQSVIFLHQTLSDDSIVRKIRETYQEFFPNGRNAEGYYRLREYFNSIFLVEGFTKKISPHFHLLIQLSFNSLLRFGPNGYNVPFGRKNVDFERIEKHSELYRTKKLEFINGSYSNVDITKFDKEKTLLYFDPPYVASKYHYGGWNTENEIELLEYVDTKSTEGWKFILSNTFYHRGQSNDILKSWAEKYNVKFIDKKYNSWAASVQGVQNENDTIEVLISNFML